MKTIITSVLAIAISATSFATPYGTITPSVYCTETKTITEPKEGKKEVAVNADFTKESDKLTRKMQMVAEKSADLKSQLTYKQSMATLLNTIEVEKHNNQVANLNAEINYNTVMTKLLMNMEQENLNNTMDDLKASVQYATLMEFMLDKVALK